MMPQQAMQQQQQGLLQRRLIAARGSGSGARTALRRSLPLVRAARGAGAFVAPAAAARQCQHAALTSQRLGSSSSSSRWRSTVRRHAAPEQQQQQQQGEVQLEAPPLSPPPPQQPQQQQQQQQWALLPSQQLRTRAAAAADADANAAPLPLLSVAALAGAAGVLGSGFSLDGPGATLQALGVLAAIIAVHEAGHFAAARLQGIHVTQFAIGFGPPLVTFTRGGVEYSLRAVPLGGYVAFPDDELTQPPPPPPAAAAGAAAAGAAAGGGADGAEQQQQKRRQQRLQQQQQQQQQKKFAPDDPDLLQNRPLPQRALVISAGVLANVAFALAVLLLQVCTVGRAQTAFLPGVLVPEVNPGGAAEAAGFKPGDLIVRVGDYEVPATAQQVPDVVAAIKARPNQAVDFIVQRGGGVGTVSSVGAGAGVRTRSFGGGGGGAGAAGGEAEAARTLRLTATPAPNRDGQGAIGVSLLSHTTISHTHPRSPGEAAAMAWGEFARLSTTVLYGLRQILTNFGSMAGQLSGPVAIVAAGSEIARTDAAGLYQFAAIVNINLAVVNTLPLPALDGGYMALLALEAARGGRKLPGGVERGVMAGGLLLLTALGVGLAIRDTVNLVF